MIYIGWIDPYLDKLKNGPTEPYVRKNQGRESSLPFLTVLFRRRYNKTNKRKVMI